MQSDEDSNFSDDEYDGVSGYTENVFDPSDYRQKLLDAGMLDDATYIYGWYFAPGPMMKNFEHFSPPFFSDASHLKGPTPGNIFVRHLLNASMYLIYL